MKTEKTKYQQMIESCPMLYAQHKLPMSETCMCWGIEAGKGWFAPLNKLSQRLERLNEFYKKDRVVIQASQVKEKFGTLRFYYDIVCLPTPFNQKIINGIRSAVNFIKKHVKFEYKHIVDKESYISEEWDEISKEDYDKQKIREYASNKFGWKFKEENGKYYRNAEVFHATKSRYVLQNHKFLNWIINELSAIAAKLTYYEPSERQNIICLALDEEAAELIRKCEDECYDYCEDCGRQIGVSYSPRCQTKGWVRFICDSCAKKLKPGTYLIDGKDPTKKEKTKKSNKKNKAIKKDNQ